MKKMLAVLFVVALCALAAGQEKQSVAVYMAGVEPKDRKGVYKVFGGELVSAMSRSGKYSVRNRTDEVLALLAKEITYTRSGAVSTNQKKDMGKQLNVKFVCSVEISAVMGEFYINVEMVDVETSDTPNSATGESGLKNLTEIRAVAQKIANELVGGGGGSVAQADATFVDSRDGKTYRTVKIDNQMWMAANLSYNATSSKCYENDAANCEKYGRLYDWSTAKGACPAGWHLPSDEEWETLVNYAGGKDKAGMKLKSSTGWPIVWNNNGNGTDNLGFSALPGGNGYSDGGFGKAGSTGYWLSATERDASYIWNRVMGDDVVVVYKESMNKSGLYSVRCLQNK